MSTKSTSPLLSYNRPLFCKIFKSDAAVQGCARKSVEVDSSQIYAHILCFCLWKKCLLSSFKISYILCKHSNFYPGLWPMRLTRLWQIMITELLCTLLTVHCNQLIMALLQYQWLKQCHQQRREIFLLKLSCSDAVVIRGSTIRAKISEFNS